MNETIPDILLDPHVVAAIVCVTFAAMIVLFLSLVLFAEDEKKRK